MALSRTICVLRWAIAPLVVWGLYFVRGNVWFRLYPAVMAAIALSAFAASLFRTPLVEIIARRMGERLDEGGVAYCRSVTRVWTAFLALHLLVTFATVFASLEAWAFYNGFLAYVLMGVLFVGELSYRRRIRRG